MTASTAERVAREAGQRFWELDAFRGAAILVMMLDHVVLVTGGPGIIRETVGRLAMPMFFVLAGYLARRPNLRTGVIALTGLALPLVVPWIDNPNVLVLWALGVLLLAACRWAGVPAWALVVLALTVAANGWVSVSGHYDPAALVGLMGLGSMLSLDSFALARRLPRWFAVLGRRPVLWYVGHLLLLQGVIWWAVA